MNTGVKLDVASDKCKDLGRLNLPSCNPDVIKNSIESYTANFSCVSDHLLNECLYNF